MNRILLATVFSLWLGYALFLGAGAGRFGSEDTQPKGTNAFQKVTGGDTDDEREYWDTFFKTSAYVYGTEPAAFLKDNVHWLPLGRVLDLAMGEGQDAVFLAKRGFVVDGVDYSDEALRKAHRMARENRVSVNTINADLNHYNILPEHYEVVVDIQYLQRSLIPQIKRGLKHGGVVVFQCWTVDQRKNAPGQHLSQDDVLDKGELKELFKDFQVLVYRETNNGVNAVAGMVARKP